MTVYVGDVGSIVEVETGITLTGAAFTNLVVLKPDGTNAEWVGSIQGDDDSKINYTIVTNDLDQAGKYYIQAYVSLGSWTGHGERTSFMVRDPVDT